MFIKIVTLTFMVAISSIALADAQHDALMETMRQMNEISIQGAGKWYSQPKRVQYLKHYANEYAYSFREQVGRYPNRGDVQFIQNAMTQVGVQNVNEAGIFQNALLWHGKDEAANPGRDDQICAGMRMLGMKYPGCP